MAILRRDPDSLARDQFRVFDGVCAQIAITDEERRRALQLTPEQWLDWRNIRDGGPIPQSPEVPEMLLRMGVAAYQLSLSAEPTQMAA